jgi:hypothetical protein
MDVSFACILFDCHRVSSLDERFPYLQYHQSKSYQTLLWNARDRHQRDFPFPLCCGLEEGG